MDPTPLSQFELHGISIVVFWHAVCKAYEIVSDNGGVKGIVGNFWRGKAAPPKPAV